MTMRALYETCQTIAAQRRREQSAQTPMDQMRALYAATAARPNPYDVKR